METNKTGDNTKYFNLNHEDVELYLKSIDIPNVIIRQLAILAYNENWTLRNENNNDVFKMPVWEIKDNINKISSKMNTVFTMSKGSEKISSDIINNEEVFISLLKLLAYLPISASAAFIHWLQKTNKLLFENLYFVAENIVDDDDDGDSCLEHSTLFIERLINLYKINIMADIYTEKVEQSVKEIITELENEGDLE